MNKIEKILRKMRSKEREALLLVMMQLKADFKKIPGVKALIGKKRWYRVRVGRYRIIFVVNENNNIEIVCVTKRDDRTYSNLD